ncbi:MAG TPA: SUMF1/EgtB/PvdO family nonheme iron enzyme, partial [Chloroflexota bacterium]|nr:SUMF1/EgtB/PvdO family nonheme iron enzyme [Chloroflexota bacterium]
MIADNRYAFVLLGEGIQETRDSDARAAWDVLRRQMALVPDGSVPVLQCDGTCVITEVRGFFLDRYAVTNRQYQRFVAAAGYDTLEIWPPDVWPSLMRFTDRTGQPGPRDWENRTYPSRLADHPVVGICWHEARAYARWVGKRLPTAIEWQKAGGWPEHLSGGTFNRFPWGNLFDP